MEPSSGILTFPGSCADACATNAHHAMPAASAAAAVPRNSALDRGRRGLPLAARFNIGMLLAKGIIVLHSGEAQADLTHTRYNYCAVCSRMVLIRSTTAGGVW